MCVSSSEAHTVLCVRACARDGDCVLSSRVSRRLGHVALLCASCGDRRSSLIRQRFWGARDIRSWTPGRARERRSSNRRRRRSSFKLMEFVRAVFDTGCAAVTVDRDAVNWGSQKKRIMQRERERRRFVGFSRLYRYEDSFVLEGACAPALIWALLRKKRARKSLRS